jgi:hypothetical protein
LTEEDLVRSRLTAMAVETGDCQREDLYTLFVTTRIINFLKGFALDASTDLMDLLQRHEPDPRTQIGMELLAQLFKTDRLYFWSRQGLVENRRFRPELFRRTLQQAGEIGCQNGAKLSVENIAGCSKRSQRQGAR